MADKSGVPAILDGISRKLDEVFGLRVYGDEEIEQGLEPPAFFIAVLSPSRVPELGPRYRARNPFDIHYFPGRDGDTAALHTMAEQLFPVLESIQLEGVPVRGTSMSYEVVDGVLHFFVSYDLPGVRAYTTEPVMEELIAHVEAKE